MFLMIVSTGLLNLNYPLLQVNNINTWLQSWHSGGVPEQDPPNVWEKQEPEVGPDLGGPV